MTTVDPTRTALMIMDFQGSITSRLNEAERAALVARVSNLRDRARAAGAHVGYVRVALTAEEAAAVPASNKSFSALAANATAYDPDGPGTQVIDDLAPAEGEFVVRKRRVGAFSTTDLGDQLAARGVDILVLTGISTSGVVLSTVRDAADHDFALVVVSDCCHDPNPLAHEALINEVFPRQADVVTADEVRFE
ncbi:MAG: isochorismatase-family hydrolase [Aeromicrobium sp.]|nr:isochorismatase-family hydrolase [Aeromicrobium sp.]